MAIKRMNYFKGEFLQAQDFKDEQQYHVDMLRRHNKNLHTWGIADGLDITFIVGEKKITVTKGMAIDAKGKQIVLLEDKEIDLSASTETTLYVTVSYKEIPTDPRDETGIKDNTRITEETDIKHEKDKPSDPSVDLILGKVILNPDKTIKEIDKSERKNAGVVGGDLEVKSLAFSLPIATDQWPKIKGLDGGSPGIEITSNKTSFTGDLNVAGKVDGRDVSADGTKLDNHVGITSGNPHGTTAAQVGALPVSGGTLSGNLQVNGNIGTTGTVDGVDISSFKSDVDNRVSQYFQFANLNYSSVNVSSSWTKLNTTLGTHSFTKKRGDTKIEVYVNSRFSGGIFTGSNGIQFQVRIDDTISPNFGNDGAILTSNTADFLSIYAVFQNLTTGPHAVSLWAKTNAGSSSSVMVDPGGWGGKIVVKESW